MLGCSRRRCGLRWLRRRARRGPASPDTHALGRGLEREPPQVTSLRDMSSSSGAIRKRSASPLLLHTSHLCADQRSPRRSGLGNLRPKNATVRDLSGIVSGRCIGKGLTRVSLGAAQAPQLCLLLRLERLRHEQRCALHPTAPPPLQLVSSHAWSLAGGGAPARRASRAERSKSVISLSGETAAVAALAADTRRFPRRPTTGSDAWPAFLPAAMHGWRFGRCLWSLDHCRVGWIY
jgi:hypothetical protein